MRFSINKMIGVTLGLSSIGACVFGAKFIMNTFDQYDQKVNDRMSAIENNAKLSQASIETSIKTLSKQSQSYDQKLSALALSIKTGSGDSEQAQELLKLILASHHDLDVVIQALLSSQILSGDLKSVGWIVNLDRLSPQDKLTFQRMLEKRTTWKEVLAHIQLQLEKNQPTVIWSAAQKLGIRIENAVAPQTQAMEQLKVQVEQRNYSFACQNINTVASDEELVSLLEDVCLADQFVSQYWKSLSD